MVGESDGGVEGGGGGCRIIILIMAFECAARVGSQQEPTPHALTSAVVAPDIWYARETH